MSCAACNVSIDCPADEMFPYSLTGNSVFPFIIVCPTGANCYTAPAVTMTCCGQQITTTMPVGASVEERLARMQALLQQCQNLITGCSGGSDTPAPPGSTFWLSGAQTVTSECPNTGGTYRYTLEAGRFLAASSAAANAMARAYANAVVSESAFCLNPPGLCPCVAVSSTYNISISGGQGPFTVLITDGALPAGMSLSVSGGMIRLTGTAVTPGVYEISVKVTDGIGGYLERDLTVRVLQIGYTLTSNASFTVPNVGDTEDMVLVSATNATVGDTIRLARVTSGVTVDEYGRFLVTAKAGTVLTLQNVTGTPAEVIASGATVYDKLATLPEFEQGVDYSFQLPGSGGSGNYAFRVSDGALPDGLTMTAAGLISGTPTGVSDAEFDIEMIDTSCQAADRSFYRPIARIVATSTRTIATILGYPEWPGGTSTPPKKYKKVTWEGSSEISYTIFANALTAGSAEYAWSGVGEINDVGTQVGNYTKNYSTECPDGLYGPYGPQWQPSLFGGTPPGNLANGYCWSADSNNCASCGALILFGDVATNNPVFDAQDFVGGAPNAGLLYLSSTFAQRVSSGSGVAKIQPEQADGYPDYPGSSGNYLSYTYTRNYSATLSDEYTDAIALSNASVSASTSVQAYSYPRTTGYVSQWQTVAFQIRLSNLVFGEPYLVEIDFLTDLGVTTTRPYEFTATGSTHTISDTAPVPADGHSLTVRNARADYQSVS